VDEFFVVAVFVVALVSGATASVVGFGIGSLLTPLFAAKLGTPVAVAIVALPHAFASIVRAIRLRASIDWSVVRSFGIVSAIGGLIGALVYSGLGGRSLTLVLGALLVLTASAGITGWSSRWHPRGPLVWLLGLLSGFFGGVAGNQGGIRAAAMSSFRLSPTAFVATATAIAVLVDVGRTPIYLWRAGAAIEPHLQLIGIASAGVLLGTVIGERVLRAMSPATFRWIIHVTIGLLGVWLIVHGAKR
jgi:uncharacterized membrane protein YfcA